MFRLPPMLLRVFILPHLAASRGIKIQLFFTFQHAFTIGNGYSVVTVALFGFRNENSRRLVPGIRTAS